MKKLRLIAVVGPTASGKTALAIELAERMNGEIVSADSRQIYRGMDIGTAKATAAEQGRARHHLIDIRNPDEEYTVAEYKQDADAAIADITARGKLPILAGGTGLYIDAIVQNLDIPSVKADPALRAKLEAEIAAEGLAAVFEKLITLDPEAAYVVDPANPRRVVRALEVAITTGKPFTSLRKKREPKYDALTIGLYPGPTMLRKRIDRRADAMVRDGVVAEVEGLVKKYGAETQSFDAIGYREIIRSLNGELSLEAAVEEIKKNTWHYARRQMTWFRKNKDVRWAENAEEALAITLPI